jgi:hypothetical protein
MHAQQHRLYGKVTNAKMEPLSYVTVQVKGEQIGTRTDDKGNYEFKLEEGEYEIPELKRWTEKNPEKPVSVFTGDKNLPPVELNSGIVGCHAFPIVVMTSNGERDFPPAFKRRCIRIKMPNPGINNLKSIVKSHMGDEYFDKSSDRISQLITDFLDKEKLATDQLLNVVYMLTGGPESTLNPESLKELLFKSLNDTEGL